jgi:hypothetical protein
VPARKRTYHFGNGTLLKQLGEYGRVVASITLCGIDTQPVQTPPTYLHTDARRVNCPDCNRILTQPKETA